MASRAETQVTFRLPKSLADRLAKLARRTGTKRSELLRQAAAAYIDVAELGDPSGRLERVRHLLGSVATGIPDLAENHSAYLKRVLRRAR